MPFFLLRRNSSFADLRRGNGFFGYGSVFFHIIPSYSFPNHLSASPERDTETVRLFYFISLISLLYAVVSLFCAALALDRQ